MDEQTRDELKARILENMRASRAHWLGRFDERQQRLIANARTYAANDPAGVPGHNLMLIIDKMAELLDGYEGVDALDKPAS